MDAPFVAVMLLVLLFFGFDGFVWRSTQHRRIVSKNGEGLRHD